MSAASVVMAQYRNLKTSAADEAAKRQGRNLEEAPHDLRPSIKKPSLVLTVGWSRFSNEGFTKHWYPVC